MAAKRSLSNGWVQSKRCGLVPCCRSTAHSPPPFGTLRLAGYSHPSRTSCKRIGRRRPPCACFLKQMVRSIGWVVTHERTQRTSDFGMDGMSDVSMGDICLRAWRSQNYGSKIIYAPGKANQTVEQAGQRRAPYHSGQGNRWIARDLGKRTGRGTPCTHTEGLASRIQRSAQPSPVPPQRDI